MQEQRKYCAFISYRHTFPDKPIAVVLQQQLERYKVPSYLQKQGFPARLGFVFRDESELPTSSDLGHQIQTALDNSDYLIVICSPSTPLSKYVAAEIEYFKKIKGDNKCLTLLVTGDPSTEKVFPDELLTRYSPHEDELEVIEPIAADVRANTLKSTFKKLKISKLKIVAGLLGCNYDDLVRRQREHHLKRITMFSLAAVLFLICFGAFLLSQLYIVNENQRKTQLAYSEQSLTRGNHVLAMEQAMAAMKKNNTLFSKDISQDIKDDLFKASFTPAFSLYTQIPLMGQLENGFFTLDGKQIIVKSDLWIKGYSTQGKLIWDFTVAGKGDRIVSVSSDGSRAAIVKTNWKQKAISIISLWDTKKNICMTQLLDSANYSIHDVLQMEFSNVLQANFSPDGRYICAYRAGGYFNENKVIQFWNTSTGILEKSIDATLLGTRQDGGQGSIILESQYFENGIIRFKGSTNYVFFHLDWKKPVVVPLRESSASDYISLSKDERFGVYMDESSYYCIKDRSSQKYYKLLRNNGKSVDINQIKYINQKYAVMPIMAEEDLKKCYVGIQVINLETMKLYGSYLFSKVSYNQFKELTLLTKDGSEQVYIIGTDGSKKLKNAAFEKKCSTLWMFTLSQNDLSLLSQDLDYLNEGIWNTTRLSGDGKDFLVSQHTDKSGNMKVLELNPKTKEIQNLYHLLMGEEFDVQCAEINAEGCYLLVKENTSLSIYNLRNKPNYMMKEVCETFAESADSDWMATFNRGVLKVWKNNEIQKQLILNEKELGLYLSNNGKVLLGINVKNEIILWNAENLTERCRIVLKQDKCQQIILSPDGRRISAIVGENLNLYDSESGRLIKTLSDQVDTETRLGYWSEKMAFSPDGTQVACVIKYFPDGQDGYTEIVSLWNVETGKNTGVIPTIYVDKKGSLTYKTENRNDFPPSIESVFFSKGGTKICTSFLNTFWIWDIKTKLKESTIQEEGVPQDLPYIDDDDNLLVCAVKGVVHVWNLKTKQKEKIFTLEGGILNYAISPEKRWLLGLNPEGVWLFDLKTGECVTKVLNEVAFAQWTNKGEFVSYYSFENAQFNCIPYLYNKPYEVCQKWLNNKE